MNYINLLKPALMIEVWLGGHIGVTLTLTLNKVVPTQTVHDTRTRNSTDPIRSFKF